MPPTHYTLTIPVFHSDEAPEIGVQDGRRDSRGTPLNCQIWVGQEAPRTNRRRMGVERDWGVRG